MLLFFNNVNTLSDAYAYLTVNCNLPIGDTEAFVVMFHLNTSKSIKDRVISDLSDAKGKVKVVLCSSSLSMGLNMASIKYVIHYGPPTTADAFLQETGRASRGKDTQGHSIMLTYPRMASGRKLDGTMKSYIKHTSCLRNILLSKFKCTKPVDQHMCCDICDTINRCELVDLIDESYESSITDSFSDDSLASAGSIGSLSEFNK